MLRKSPSLLLLAARWALDVIRGYQMVADGRDGLHEMQTHSPTAASADAESGVLRLFAEARMMSGGFGLGARLAVTFPELAAIQVRIDMRRKAAASARVEA
jgi:hypothetical protein